MDTKKIIRMLEIQQNPEILFSDIDGTLFSPNLNLLTAPIYNLQATSFLRNKSIPFITVTGRSFWRRIDQYHLSLLGMPKADAVITANGTAIYYLQKGSYASDFGWQGIMQSTKITDQTGKVFSWNKRDISNALIEYLQRNHYLYGIGKGNTYLIRLRLNQYPVETINKIRKEILQLFPKGLRVMFTEKLLWKNTKNIFSGEMLIVPSTSGKDNAVLYLLKNFSTELNKPIHALLFGDATIDVPMLSMKEDTRYYTLSQYGIRPTPLARIYLEEKQKTNNNLHILYGDGPQEILWTLRPELRKSMAKKPVIGAYVGVEKEKEENKKLQLTAAQNNKARSVIRKFEWILDKIVDKNMSPNEISFLGLQKLSEGLKNLQQKSFAYKTKGLYQYGFGNLTDILDGIRARNSDKKEENGQLVDGFSDRVKEFIQLFHRAKKRMKQNETLAEQTLLAALSCALPSIARAQVEINGKTVSERDEKGGSMIDRTRRLFASLLFDTLGLDDYSFGKDKEIFETNQATFQHRFSFVKKLDLQKLQANKLSGFQKKALERFLLYVDVLQQEDAIITKFLSKQPKLLKQYKKESEKLAKNYFGLQIKKLQEKFSIPDYKFEVKKYL